LPRDAAKPKLWVCQLYNPVLTPDTKIVMDAMCEKYGRAQASENARDALAWSTNLVSDKRYRLCPDGCGLVFMSRHNKGEHIDPEELIADWQTDDAQHVDAFMNAPVEPLLKPAVSVAQVRLGRDVIAQYPRMTRERICRENGGISWEPLQHYAQSDARGLPERKGQEPPAPKAQAKPAEKPVKPKPAPKSKVKEA
jgi:hypothetical protein